MAVETEYRCDRCACTSYVMFPVTGHYNVADIVKPELFSGVGWCECCASLTEVETIPTKELIEIYRVFLREMYEGVDANFFDQSMATCDASEDYFRKRSSPPKCLRCGSSEIIHFETTEILNESAVHPGCGGRFKETGENTAFVNLWHRVLDTEGIVIGYS